MSTNNKQKRKIEGGLVKSRVSDYYIFIIGLVLILLSNFSKLEIPLKSTDVVNKEEKVSKKSVNTMSIFSNPN